MELNQLSEIMRAAGVVGAGGAGFPSYAKLNMAAFSLLSAPRSLPLTVKPHAAAPDAKALIPIPPTPTK